MPICAIAKETADGLVLVLDPMQTNPATCPYVVETGSESLVGSLAALTPDQALIIGTAVWGLWALCWGFKQVARSVFNPTNEGNDYE